MIKKPSRLQSLS